ncbi:NAD(P)-dependent dehydrogenase, short-chain alcohol dehydrogenase family [Sphingomonas sp. YR710]|uniref:SDR family NAD(P)-dependent oxidoreductase n=1 Tax=Sphingomonas sp. YR710 TaxID=1882773 RepID=UPI0008810B00|nr:SDR family NAD(P)-dependent oxidoreductase [Sphingomonas sp. YR710]SDC73219.1 NAD(P)-dependent dehydrogenase, short-chain alcohol dehydrogenase family [Sphingomonas sp. YR710]
MHRRLCGTNWEDYMGTLDGKVAIVTGAGSGMGKATAKILAREGAKVVAADISGLQEQTVAEIGANAIAARCDISDEAQLSALVDLAVEKFGRLDAMLNVAGIGAGGPIESMSAQDLDRMLNVNLKGMFFGAKHAVRAMKNNGGGAIINWSSLAGLIPSPNSAAYAISKAGVVMMTKSFAVECGKYNIRSNAICPGLILTEGMGQAAAKAQPDRATVNPLGRPGLPEEAGELAAFLVSDRGSYINGVAIPIDGGWGCLLA